MNRFAVLALLVLGRFLAAAGATRTAPTHIRSDRRGIYRAIAEAPAKARARENPYAGRRDAVLAGLKLYSQHCAECHGEIADGLGHAADLHSAGVQKATPGELEWFLRNGNLRKGMPSWSGLPPQRRWLIVTYLKTLH